MSELISKHPMTIKDELLQRAVKILKVRGVDQVTQRPSDYTWREFKTDLISIADASDGIFTIGVGKYTKWAPVWMDAIRCKDSLGLVLNYDHHNAIRCKDNLGLGAELRLSQRR